MATVELSADGTVTVRLPDPNGRVMARVLRRPNVGEYRDRLAALHDAVAPVEVDRMKADAESRRLFELAAAPDLDHAETASRLAAARDHSRRAGAECDQQSDDAVARWLADTIAVLAPKADLADPDLWPIDALNGVVPTEIVAHWRVAATGPFDSSAKQAKAR